MREPGNLVVGEMAHGPSGDELNLRDLFPVSDFRKVRIVSDSDLEGVPGYLPVGIGNSKDLRPRWKLENLSEQFVSDFQPSDSHIRYLSVRRMNPLRNFSRSSPAIQKVTSMVTFVSSSSSYR